MSIEEQQPGSDDPRERELGPKNPYMDPTGAGAAFVASARKHQGRPVLDWIDGVLIFTGLATMVLFGVIGARLSESVAESMRTLSRVAATPFAFGPVLIRRAMFSHTLDWAGTPREGAGYRLLSVAGLLLTALATFCVVIVMGSVLDKPEGTPLEGIDEASHRRFVQEQLRGLDAEPSMMEALAYAEVARAAANDRSPEGLARRQAWISEQRRAGIESQWQSERLVRLGRAESHARASRRSWQIGVFGVVALLLGVTFMRLRYDRSSVVGRK